jgi:murein DD-endopeptidase MepM/ murein hydrolase activator NlpD
VTSAGLRPGPGTERDRAREAARALEAMVLKQIVAASGAFKGGDAAGAAIREDLFASTLAEALVKGGGIGLAAQIERSVLGEPAAPAPGPAPRPLPAPGTAPATPASDPVADAVLSSPFGLRTDPLTGEEVEHRGVDLAAPEGTDIRAALDGVVRSTGVRGGYGLAVEIQHGDGLTTLYAHASELLVRDGDRVTRGQPIARVGQTGRSTGPHLHLEVHRGGRPVDPLRALKVYARRVEAPTGSGS